jgi:hypothetical protein
MVSDRSEQLGDSGGYRRLYSIAGTYHAYQPKFVALTVDLLLCQLSALSLKSGYEEWVQIQRGLQQDFGSRIRLIPPLPVPPTPLALG